MATAIVVAGVCACVSLFRGIKSSSVSDSQKVEETDGAFDNAESAEADMSETEVSEVEEDEKEVEEPLATEEEEDEDGDFELDPIDTDKYFAERSQIVDEVYVKDSTEVMSEAEVYAFLKDRGFDVENAEIVTGYDMDCNWSKSHEISAMSDEKHPMYDMFYLSASGDISDDVQRYMEGPMDDEEDELFWDVQEDNDTIWPKKEWQGSLLLWNISIIDGDIIAIPSSYFIERNIPGDIAIVEKEVLTGFGSSLKKFYKHIPNDGTRIIKVVDRVDRETLDSISNEVLEQLCAEE